MIKAMVVDDEALTNEYICRLIRNLDVEVTGYTNPHEAFDNINIQKPDVLFLDIEMPEMNGLELAEKVHASGYEGEFIFITAYNQYAIDAFRVNALDYLLKPIRDNELNRSIERVKKRMAVNLYNKMNSINKKIRISLFGKMSIYVGENKKNIRWMTAKSAEVVAFILLQKTDTETAKWKLMDEVWPDKNKEKADINLRSTISRVNKTLRENDIAISVISVGKGYKLHIMEPDVEIDVFKLEDMFFKHTNINDENIELYDKIISSYKPILEEFNSEWCYEAREIYHRYFISGAKKLVNYYKNTNIEPLKILKVIELIIRYEPYDEETRENALRMHYSIGGKKSAEKYYIEYSEVIKNELQIEPSYSMKKLYKWMLENN